MRYPIAIHHDDNSAYGVTVPDIPGCFSAGDTFDEALINTEEAILGHIDILAEDGDIAPLATSIEAHRKNPDFKEATWGFVDVDITPFLGKSEKINVTLPSFVIHKIEQAGVKNRSKFLAEAALKALG